MPIPNVPDTSLAAIETKVRRLTQSPSEQQLSTADLDDYINTFFLYDFPEHLRLFALRTTLTFYTSPNVASYSTTTTNPLDPLFNFNNQYISVHDPIYIAGYRSMYTQSPEQFYNIFPFVNNIATQTTGNGASTGFPGFLSPNAVPVLASVPFVNPSITPPAASAQSSGGVTFNSIDVNNNALVMIDYPINGQIGNLYPYNGTPTSTTVQDANNYINYLTGQYVVTFTAAPGAGVNINSLTYPYQPARPLAMLYYDDQFTLRPVPDQSYPVNFEVYTRPTQLFASTSIPQLQQWWQYIAYGAAKKVLEDRLDMETVALIMPEFKKQETLVLRTTIVQNTNERVATLYTEQTSVYGGPWGWGGNGSL